MRRGRAVATAALAGLVAALGLFGACAVDRALNRVTGPGAGASDEALRLHAGLVVVDLHADPLLWDRDLADRAQDPRLVAGLLAIEGLHCLEGRLENVDALFAAGFRMMGLAHFFDNEVAGSAHGAEKGGLTPLGEAVLDRMETLGIALDLAHASPRAVDDALSRARKPPLVSHTGVQATCPGPRNLSDDQLRRVAATGGAVGIAFFPEAVCGKDVGSIVRAIRHARDVAGPGAVALGSDWDGATTTPFDAAGLPALTGALLGAGLTPDEIRAVAGENALRVLRATLPE
jgi:microsomal dipeptidase-like Zn-dependent dipeptidase